MSVSYQIPRSTREAFYTAAAGQTVFGPVGFTIFEIFDIGIYQTLPGGIEQQLDPVNYTTVLTGAAPSSFIVTFTAGRVAGALINIRGKRTPSRTTDVTRSGILQSQPLERELDKSVLTEQELRRDIDKSAAATRGLLLADVDLNAQTAVLRDGQAGVLAARAEAIAAKLGAEAARAAVEIIRDTIGDGGEGLAVQVIRTAGTGSNDYLALQASLNAVAAEGGGTVSLRRGKTYRCVMSSATPDQGLVVPAGVTLSLNNARISFELQGDCFGIRLLGGIVGPGKLTTDVSVNSGSQNCWHSPIMIGYAYGQELNAAALTKWAEPSGWFIKNVTCGNVRNDVPVAGFAGGAMVSIIGGAHHGLIEDITILPSASCALGIAMDWGPVGNPGIDSNNIPASAIRYAAGTAYTLHPHDITVRRVNIGALSTPKVNGFGSHGVRLSGVYNILCEDVTADLTTFAGVFHTAGDCGFEFARATERNWRHTGIVFRNVHIKNAYRGWGAYCDTFADNIAAAVTVYGYAAMLPTTGETNILFENFFTFGSGEAAALPGFFMIRMTGGEIKNCRARLHAQGVLLSDGANRVKITKGTFDSCWTYGLMLYSSVLPPEDCMIDSAVAMSNGFAGNADDAGIRSVNGLRTVIRNCRLGILGDSFQKRGLWLDATTSGAIVEDNYVDGVAAGGVAFVLGGGQDYGVVTKFSGNRARSTIATKYGGNNIIPYAYALKDDGEIVRRCRAPREALASDVTPQAGAWVRGDIIEYNAPAASGAWGVICVASGTPGTWKTLAGISA